MKLWNLSTSCFSAYNDGGQPTSLTYSDGEVAREGYDTHSGWLTSLTTTPNGGTQASVFTALLYSGAGAGGAAGHPSSATVAGAYSYAASYDSDLRLSSLSLSRGGNTLFESQRGYDAVGNVTAVGTTLAAGTDNQVFCYDDQHRLTWAGSAGTPNCGTSLTPGSLTAANYTQTFTYDTLDRLQSGPLGSYTYGDSAHLHAVTAIGTNYSASYDAGGNMTCRAADGSTTCAGTPNGAQLSYDNEGRLTAWQNTPTNPTSSDSFLADGEGNRVEQQTTTNGSIITSTVYVAGGLEEITSTGASTTLTKYFQAAGLPLVERVGTSGPLTTLASDGQGTVSEALDGAGNVISAQLYTPYGSVRYSSGSSPTSLGYTGQRADSATGLDYYHARYYDPVAGQFTSADTVHDGLNRYGYVRGNPTTATDPSGHRRVCDGDCWAPSPPPSTPPPPPPSGTGCHGDGSCGCYETCGGGGAASGGGGAGGSFGGGGGSSCSGTTAGGGFPGGGAAGGGGGASGGFAALISDSGCGDLSAEQFQALIDEAQRLGVNLTELDIEEMINANPGLPYYQYELLVQLWGEGIRAYNVKEIAYAENGRLVWLDGVQLKHIEDEHWEDFRDYFSIRVEGIPMYDIVGTIFDFLMNERPVYVNGDTYSYGFWDSLYDRFRGVEQTFDIVVNYQGRIITAYVPTPK